ncbi:MAG: Rpn family recombination-promoting nuclease/putative transposase, partial [Selenomonadaceae bacterium]|nr:Rpn family recombination-promoting nuclease/putative transposase [Selenomonadaceae bacterium]
MEREVIAKKRWFDATIRDNFLFSKTMEMYSDLCRQLLELILNLKIRGINYPEREKTVEACIDGKGIRLDVYVEDDNKRSFDVEMQLTDSDNLSKRMRYYQGLIDIDKLKRGQHYSALGETFIIFICTFDRFKLGRYIYTFQERCTENPNLLLNDGATKVFLNTKGTVGDVPPDLKAFLDYVDCGIVSGKFVKELDAAVKSIKTNEKVRHDFMTLQMALLEERLEGEERKAEAIAVKMLRKGKSFEEVHEFTDLPVQRLK